MKGSALETLLGNFSWPTLVLAVAVCIALYVYTRWTALPHGPVGIPYLGYYPYVTDDFHLQLGELAKKYGEVFCIRVTGQLYVHLATHRAVREAHVTKAECFSERSMNFSLLKDMLSDGLFNSNGEPWKVLRKFFVQTLKEFGMGKDSQETIIAERLRSITEVLEKSDGGKVDILQLFSDNCSLVVRQLLFSGGKVDEEDCEQLNSAYKVMMYFFKGPTLLMAGPVAEHLIFPRMKGYKEYKEAKILMDKIMYKIIKQHEDTFDKDNLRNILDYFIDERRILREKGDPKADYYTDQILVGTLIQLFGDGGLAVGWVISDTIKEIIKYPDVQRTIQSEIDEVVGRERFPNWGDRSRLQYLSATLYEVQRTSDFICLFPTLSCTKQTSIRGIRIPRGTITLLNLWSIHHDPEVYEDPHKFDPSRYMSTKDKKTKAELPILFGVGKRSCAGESLTNMQVLLFIAAILQNFDLHAVEKDSSPGVEEVEDWKIQIRATRRVV